METIFELGPDYKGRFFGPPFFVAEWHGIAPGWFVFGRNGEYGCRCIKMVARPDVPPRKYKHWNGQLSRGWWKKYEAQAVADRLNNKEIEISGRLLPALEINDSVLSYDQNTTLFYLDTPEMCVTIDDFTPGYSMGVQGCFESLLSFMSFASESADDELFEPAVLRWCQQNEEEINCVNYELRDNLDLIQ